MNPPQRITFVSSSLGSGGAERVLSIVANALAAQGRSVSVLVTSTHKTEPFYELAGGIEFRAPFAGRGYRNKAAALAAALSITRRLKREILATEPDAVVSFVDKTNVLTLISLSGTAVPVVACEHIYPPSQPIGPFWGALRLFAYPRATLVTVLTEEAALFFPPRLRRKIVVLPNPVLPPPPEARSPERARRVVSAGRFTAQKGFDRLIRAFATASAIRPGWKLRILGDGPLRGELEALRDSLGLRDSVQLPGITRDIYGEFREAAFYALSSRFEGFPMTLCEAMASGLPAVAMDCMTGPRHILRDGVDGLLVSEGDEAALAVAMGRLMDDGELRARLGARAPEVCERFSLERIMAMWDDILARVASSGREAR
jgi:glycosyltransferase involved in cell wall biosynthesis